LKVENSIVSCGRPPAKVIYSFHNYSSLKEVGLLERGVLAN